MDNEKQEERKTSDKEILKDHQVGYFGREQAAYKLN